MQPRKTLQKSLTLNAVKELKNHPKADEVYNYVIKTHPEVSKATVYRNLNFLCETGMLTKVKTPNGADRFDHTLHQHYHFRCKSCDSLCDSSINYMESLNNNSENELGIVVTEHQLFFEGLCKNCI